jgi:hypothetical protein
LWRQCLQYVPFHLHDHASLSPKVTDALASRSIIGPQADQSERRGRWLRSFTFSRCARLSQRTPARASC